MECKSANLILIACIFIISDRICILPAALKNKTLITIDLIHMLLSARAFCNLSTSDFQIQYLQV